MIPDKNRAPPTRWLPLHLRPTN